MKPAKAFALACSFLTIVTLPAFAGVTVSTPVNSSTVSSPFTLYAAAAACSNQPVSAMGYSFDNSTSTTIVSATQIDGPVSVSAGGHTLHVKAWGNAGASCVTDVAITVSAASAGVPPGALFNSNLQAAANWGLVHDLGTGGTSIGGTSLASSPSISGTARGFATSYTNYGGERFSLWFGDDTIAQNFMYDGWIFIAGSNAGIASLEMDLNQVMPNGQTVIYGFQCDGWSGTWDYTANKGTAASPSDQWLHSSQPCNPKRWSVNQWHHVQIQYSRDTVGNVFYNFVVLDGAEQYLGVKVFSAFALGWAPVLLTNFQVDGATAASGYSNVYVDDLVIYRW